MMDLNQTVTIAELMVAVGTMQAEINELKASKDYWFKAFCEKEKEYTALQDDFANLKGCTCDDTNIGKCSCHNGGDSGIQWPVDHKIGGTDV